MLDPLLLLDRPQPLDPLQLLDRHQRLDVQLLLLGRPQWLDPLLLLGPQVCRLLRRIPGYVAPTVGTGLALVVFGIFVMWAAHRRRTRQTA